MDGLSVLPLAITMMMGPQILSAIILAASEKAIAVSLAFLAGVLAATLAGTAAALGLASLLGGAVDLGNSSDNGSVGRIVQYLLVALLLLAAVHNWRTRETARPPRWLDRLMTASPRDALTLGLLVILLMPSDIMIMLTVGIHLEQSGSSFAEALPFVALTLAVAAVPLATRVLARRHTEALPRYRDWARTHSWLINIIVCLLFVVLILF
ncbi:GAP family protein [Streptomyces sp. TR06-5]|uniref:GAP family protein n=1 Tax=unclassified Streptomyces TaxID=2593676 RepID=UPI0039A2E432